MKFTQYYLDCLSQASYLIGDDTTGRAVVVDPRRDIGEYVRDAADAGLATNDFTHGLRHQALIRGPMSTTARSAYYMPRSRMHR